MMKRSSNSGLLSLSLSAAATIALFWGLTGPVLAQRELEIPENLKPIPSGPGIQICEPVAPGGEGALADFGSGCALWLQWSMGFHPQLGQTPRWELASRAHQELHTPRLRLSLAQGSQLYNMLGVTHVAVGQITGTPEKCLLTYQLYAAPSQKPVGAPIKLVGTEAQIVEQLPGAARAVLTRLGVQKLQVPARVGATEAELTTLGHYPWFQDQKPTDVEQQQIDALGKKLPLATLLSYIHPLPTVIARTAAGLHLLDQADGNFLMLGLIATFDGHPTEQVARAMDRQIDALAAPNNAVLAFWVAKKARTPEASLKAYERLARLAPHSANTWNNLALQYGEQGDSIRLARITAGLTSQESAKLGEIYSRWYFASTQATSIDKDYQGAWNELAVAATFIGASDRADAAFWKAMSLDKGNLALYAWGLEMYQAKWDGDPTTLAKVARLATTAVFPPMADLFKLGTELQAAGFPAESKAMYARALVQQRDTVRQYPNDANVHAALGTYLHQQGQDAEAKTELKTAIQLDPNLHFARSSLGLLYRVHRRFTEAIVQLCEDVRITNSNASKVALAEALVYENKDPKFEEAEKLLNDVLKIQPNDYMANEDMGGLLARRKEYDAAIEMYRAASKIKPDYELPHREIGRIYRLQSKLDDAVLEGELAVSLAPRRYYPLNYLATTYAAKGDNDKSIKLYRRAIEVSPAYAPGYLELASLFLKIGKKEEGRAELKHVLEMKVSESVKKFAQDLLDKNP